MDCFSGNGFRVEDETSFFLDPCGVAGNTGEGTISSGEETDLNTFAHNWGSKVEFGNFKVAGNVETILILGNGGFIADQLLSRFVTVSTEGTEGSRFGDRSGQGDGRDVFSALNVSVDVDEGKVVGASDGVVLRVDAGEGVLSDQAGPDDIDSAVTGPDETRISDAAGSGEQPSVADEGSGAGVQEATGGDGDAKMHEPWVLTQGGIAAGLLKAGVATLNGDENAQ